MMVTKSNFTIHSHIHDLHRPCNGKAEGRLKEDRMQTWNPVQSPGTFSDPPPRSPQLLLVFTPKVRRYMGAFKPCGKMLWPLEVGGFHLLSWNFCRPPLSWPAPWDIIKNPMIHVELGGAKLPPIVLLPTPQVSSWLSGDIITPSVQKGGPSQGGGHTHPP